METTNMYTLPRGSGRPLRLLPAVRLVAEHEAQFLGKLLVLRHRCEVAGRAAKSGDGNFKLLVNKKA